MNISYAIVRLSGCRLVCGLFSLLMLLAAPVQAGLPDATRFGVVMELGNLSQAREWLDEGLSPDFMADRIGSGLMIGAWEGNIPMMELFLSRGAQINLSNANGEQALQMAAWQGHLKAVEWLLDHGAGLNREGNHWSALHYAVFAGRKEVVRLLMARGADVNAKAPNKSTVLMMAAREGHEDLARELLAAGADPRPVNDWGDNALTWAMRQNNLMIAKLVAVAPTEFAEAVRAPREFFGKPVRSTPAPQELSEILKEIRIARAQGKSVDDLEQALFAMAAKLKAKAQAESVARKGAPTALYITASRSRGAQAAGEKAELNYAGADKARGSGSAGATPASRTGGSDVSDILYRLRRAQAEGKPVDELRQALLDAVARSAKAP